MLAPRDEQIAPDVAVDAVAVADPLGLFERYQGVEHGHDESVSGRFFVM